MLHIFLRSNHFRCGLFADFETLRKCTTLPMIQCGSLRLRVIWLASLDQSQESARSAPSKSLTVTFHPDHSAEGSSSEGSGLGIPRLISPPLPPHHHPELPKPLGYSHQSNMNGIAMDNFGGLDVLSENKSHFHDFMGIWPLRGPIWGTLWVLLVDAWVKRGKGGVKKYFWHPPSPFSSILECNWWY